MEKISIVIVSMNKLNNLDICLPSIEKYTTVPHKIYVVAYLFSEKNLRLLRERYPYVTVIESNEIRGFSENNNLALRQIMTPYVFIQNDDTEYKEPVLDKLLASLKNTPEATIMSPVLWRGDGSLQYCGRGRFTLTDFVLKNVGIQRKEDTRFINKKGIFQSYNVSGAAFLISTEDFRKIGFFDEKYFFCPEDIAVGETLNRQGKRCYVDADANIIHYEGVSSKKGKLFYATVSTAYLGNYYFYGTSSIRRYIVSIIYAYKYLQHIFANFIHPNQHHKDYIYIYKQVNKAIVHSLSTKDLFTKEYKKVKQSNENPST